jgi:hypothetical protein
MTLDHDPRGTVPGALGARPEPPPDPEVPAAPGRRQFSAAYKLRILREADSCPVGEQV